MTSGTPEVRLPLIITHESTDHQENTHHVRTPSTATITDAASTCSDISNTKEQVYTNKLKAKKILSSKCERLAIAYIFVEKLDIPPQEEWMGRNGTIAIISRTLNIPKGSYRTILGVLQNVTICFQNGNEYTGERDIDSIQFTKKIKENSIEEELIATWMEEGLGFQLTTMLLNMHLNEQGLEEIGIKSVYNTFYCLNPVISRTNKKSQMPENLELWADARFNWVTQLLLRTNSIQSEGLPDELKNESFLNKSMLVQEGKMFDWAQVAYYDEIHIEQKAGMETTSGYQIRFKRDENGKLIQEKDKQGTYRDVGVSYDLKILFHM